MFGVFLYDGYVCYNILDYFILFKQNQQKTTT